MSISLMLGGSDDIQVCAYISYFQVDVVLDWAIRRWGSSAVLKGCGVGIMLCAKIFLSPMMIVLNWSVLLYRETVT